MARLTEVLDLPRMSVRTGIGPRPRRCGRVRVASTRPDEYSSLTTVIIAEMRFFKRERSDWLVDQIANDGARMYCRTISRVTILMLLH